MLTKQDDSSFKNEKELQVVLSKQGVSFGANIVNETETNMNTEKQETKKALESDKNTL